MLGQDIQGNTPDQADLALWASTYNLTHPVVADPGFGTGFAYSPDNSLGFPSFSQLAPNTMEVLLADVPSVSTAQIEGALP